MTVLDEVLSHRWLCFSLSSIWRAGYVISNNHCTPTAVIDYNHTWLSYNQTRLTLNSTKLRRRRKKFLLAVFLPFSIQSNRQIQKKTKFSSCMLKFRVRSISATPSNKVMMSKSFNFIYQPCRAQLISAPDNYFSALQDIRPNSSLTHSDKTPILK